MDIDKVKLDPTQTFDNPAQIVSDNRISKAQKLELLKQWELDAQLLQEAAAEGMTGGEDSLLRDIREAKALLEES